ncbi:MAG: mannonate dehydratase [Anaerolineae bacterium]|nr:mannonate dehydratase [Anaerolineae bacterium]
MIKISVWNGDLSDGYLRAITQLGADCIDFGSAASFPGVKEQGYPDLDAVVKIRRKIQSWGLDINRVTLPTISTGYLDDEAGHFHDVENAAKALRIFSEVGIPIARQRFEWDNMPSLTRTYRAIHRGGYLSRGEYSHWSGYETPDQASWQHRWERIASVYQKLVPTAEACGIKLAIHPSDTPYPGTPFDSLGFHRVLDAFPSKNVGFLYCIGTRAEAGGSSLVLDELNNFGRKGRLFTVHFRNVRGSLATSGGFEEVLLDDGDMNMFTILRMLHSVGFEGCVNPDHIPAIEGDIGHVSQGLAYSIGYIKALFAALSVL